METVDFGICLLRGLVAERRALAGAADDWPELLTYLDGGLALLSNDLLPEHHVTPAERATLSRLVAGHLEGIGVADAADRIELMALRGFLATMADERHPMAVSGTKLRDLLAGIVDKEDNHSRGLANP